MRANDDRIPLDVDLDLGVRRNVRLLENLRIEDQPRGVSDGNQLLHHGRAGLRSAVTVFCHN